MYGGKLGRASGLSQQAIRQFRSDLVAQRIGDDHIDPAAGRFDRLHKATVKIRLLGETGKCGASGKLITDERGPLSPQSSKKPVFIELFHIVGDILIQILQHRTGALQTFPEGGMELAIKIVHLAVIVRVFLP